MRRVTLTNSTSPNKMNVRTWPSPRVLSRLPATRHFMSPSSSVPSCTVPRQSTSLTSMFHSLLLRRYTQKKFFTIRAPSSRIPSAQTPNSLLGPFLRSSPRSFLPHGSSSSYWCVRYPFLLPVIRLLYGADNTLRAVLVVGCREPRRSSPLLA